MLFKKQLFFEHLVARIREELGNKPIKIANSKLSALRRQGTGNQTTSRRSLVVIYTLPSRILII